MVFTPGSAGRGDPFFPNAGNGGYDVSHYALTLDYDKATNHLAGRAVINATATQNLSRFDLDLRGFTIVFLFNGTIYYRAAMTLQALRQKVGDFAFFQIMRRWATENRESNVTTAQFVALAERISDMQLDDFFDVWLYRPKKPTSW